ncbi:MAG: hypothetical protein CVU51_02700 [Deltaproteobacteria bacterium HGW-Deltaproteobacteria-1]|jgi:hypothetical protein|nr:MAG: hypothetical protein CVU51_02700 [Deltaproteobacteria bacterium HGW-Deltaproteobacteria-1]
MGLMSSARVTFRLGGGGAKRRRWFPLIKHTETTLQRKKTSPYPSATMSQSPLRHNPLGQSLRAASQAAWQSYIPGKILRLLRSFISLAMTWRQSVLGGNLDIVPVFCPRVCFRVLGYEGWETFLIILHFLLRFACTETPDSIGYDRKVFLTHYIDIFLEHVLYGQRAFEGRKV